MYTIISREQCNFCDLAKVMMSKKGISYVEYNVHSTSSKWVLTLLKKTNLTTVPQVFDESGKLIGGYTELKEHLLND
ncbi:MAG: glutaredoxin [Phycisphaerae bacterium]|nr:glutaredoxin [Phycisphaerae bacterium]|tara:strand:+ start:967 stop:1197 length:231 start_codon:yes stop_codon:yes gene_type:complete